jgi:hypothetical protein
VADYDGDGHLEYAYRRSDTIRFLDPDAGLDSALWVIPFSLIGKTAFWGVTAAGKHCVDINEYHDSSWTHQTPDGTIYQRQFYWTLHVHEVMSGKTVTTVAGGPGSWHFVYGFPDAASTSLAIHVESYYELQGPPSMASRFEGVTLYGRNWNLVDSFGIKSGGFGWEPPYSYSLEHLAVHSQFDIHGSFALSKLSRFPPGQVDPAQLRKRELTAPPGSWIKTADWTGTYSSAVAFDLEQTGAVRWILPLSNSQGWERRELTTARLVDTLVGMPKCDLRTGALLIEGQPDLFYIADSTLYIWSDTTTHIHDGDDNVDNGAGPWIRATPNPFNGTVTLSWPEETVPSSLQIVNVLGQTVYSQNFRDGENVTGVVWDAVRSSGGYVASGLYFARLQARMGSKAVKLILIR